MNSIDSENIKDYILNKHQFNILRLNNPMINLYEKPIIGTEEIRQFSYCKRIIFLGT